MLCTGIGTLAGCASRDRDRSCDPPPPRSEVVVVAPVLNLSNSVDWDPAKVTDLLASELQSFPDYQVIPVNRMLAALAQNGLRVIETPQHALALAQYFNADATLVMAITEYDAYDPPAVGVILQWYGSPRESQRSAGVDPTTASRQAAEVEGPPAAHDSLAPRMQVQRVFSARDERVLDELRRYADVRDGQSSAYGWKVHAKSQELFLRFACWESIRSMNDQRTLDEKEPRRR